jgi:hypothetical protein
MTYCQAKLYFHLLTYEKDGSFFCDKENNVYIRQ